MERRESDFSLLSTQCVLPTKPDSLSLTDLLLFPRTRAVTRSVAVKEQKLNSGQIANSAHATRLDERLSPSHKEPMGMWEEASDTGMKGKKKDKNEEEEERGKKERMVNLTLEMIYLLTGEHYIPRKKSDDGGALHAPGSVIQKENNKNDKKILELMSNIIQLLTGEEWDYIGKKKNNRQSPSLERECRDKVNLQSRFFSKDDTSCSLAEDSFFCEDKNLTNTSWAEQSPPENALKEESALCEGEDHPDCSINLLTEQIQGTDAPTLITGYSLNDSLADNYISVAVKDEPTSCEESNQSDCSINPLTEQIQGTDTHTPIMEYSLNNSLADNYILNGIKVESVTWEEENQSEDSNNSGTEQIKGVHASTSLMGCSLLDRNSTYMAEFHNKSLHTSELSRETLQVTYNCRECNKDFSTKSSLARHQRAHTGAKPFSCSDCGKCFKRVAHLERHKRTHTGEKPFSCTQCGKCFTRHTQLTAHTRLHTGEKPFSCSECGKSFILHSQLKVHCRIHTGEKPFSCSECGKCFALASQLKVHGRSHSGEKPFTCSECGKGFSQSSALKVHVRIHSEEKTFSCSVCGKCFKHRSNLLIHLRIHAGDMPFSCSECGKCFIHRSHLKLHETIHTGGKQLTCSDCGKSFAYLSDLNFHRRIHTRENLFTCAECGKCFTRRSLLNVHSRIHTGEKPFACTQCGECFRYRSQLNVHQKIHQ
ncbi:hypothetical protein XELAEV_18001426mg [Xenopus laevis]|nr:hypothetical protein XELAEV_18001426mg [Xenopus laevis]